MCMKTILPCAQMKSAKYDCEEYCTAINEVESNSVSDTFKLQRPKVHLKSK